MKKFIKLGDSSFNISWLKSLNEKSAVLRLVGLGYDENQARNAWKRANGKSVRNYEKPVEEAEEEKKPRRRRVQKKDAE